MSKRLLSLNQHIFTLKNGPLSLEVNAQHGARITSFAYENQEVLTQPHEHAENFGSTLWDAPQSRWRWPPPILLDSAPYTAHVNADQLQFTSSRDEESGLQFIKVFRLLADPMGVEIEYFIKNTGSAALTTAAWEITRAPGGLTFLPSSQLTPSAASTLPGVQFTGGHAWYAIDPSPLDIGKKAFFDMDAGWLAHVTPNRMLFIKSFTPLTPDQYSPGHAAVEVYAHIDGAYVELENHGPSTLLQPGETLGYPVHWQVQPLPAAVKMIAGSKTLVEFAQEILHAKKS